MGKKQWKNDKDESIKLVKFLIIYDCYTHIFIPFFNFFIEELFTLISMLICIKYRLK